MYELPLNTSVGAGVLPSVSVKVGIEFTTFKALSLTDRRAHKIETQFDVVSI